MKKIQMFADHPEFKAPSNPDTAIWRYVSFPKFVHMLETQSLHFARLDTLGDPFEGALSSGAIEQYRQWNEAHPVPTVTGEPSFEIGTRDIYRMNSVCMYVNCWHMNPYESQAMWRTYGREGIAIRSTYSRLRQSIVPTADSINIGQVIYHDHRNPHNPENFGNTLAPLTRKGMSYQYEQELRAITSQLPPDWRGGSFPHEAAKADQPLGKLIEVGEDGLDVLIEGIYVAPACPGWLKELVTQVFQKYGLNKPVVTSDLDQRPELT